MVTSVTETETDDDSVIVVATPADPNQTLQLDCWDEELSEFQKAFYEKGVKEHNDIKAKIQEVVGGAQNIFSGEIFSAYEILGPVPGLDEFSKPISSFNKKEPKRDRGRKRERESFHAVDDSEEDEDTVPLSKRKAKEKKREKRSRHEKAPSITSVSNVRPTEATAVGGLVVGTEAAKRKPSAVVDLTKDDKDMTSDATEVSFNKLNGKTFPSLVVVARPSLRVKETFKNDRSSLDSKVKTVLMHPAVKFTEWLIQQGLVKSEQQCQVHNGRNLKLGMYSDAGKFPYSGGYVWISQCCPTRFVSVFNRSIFEGAPYAPTVLLKLIYHWTCQTNVTNVVQWVKVDNLYLKNFYSWLRSVCTLALQTHMGKMGGYNKKIEMGVISLGTTTQDGKQRQVKVEVLGILDPEQKLVRLRAVEPLSDGEQNHKKRFAKILEPLGEWVSRDSTILTDLTVDKNVLHQMGFKNIVQVSPQDQTRVANSNASIMDYLRRIVPRMFQNTLSLLSRQIIQQFLDELVWREQFGTSPGQAFDHIITHIAEQTKAEAKEPFTSRLTKVSANPYRQWVASLKSSKRK
ncbi:CLUMA_CG019459, isoform A [Clunio marinus]|uniref:CLUMA_CG019459, isoform A n=1 Tax=Clunio marinus TaxID=568069 RepID=A0A1J1J4M1_9DIPT|nr:CLUMA_CG019459, isoform A [Clunio marinus]